MKMIALLLILWTQEGFGAEEALGSTLDSTSTSSATSTPTVSPTPTATVGKGSTEVPLAKVRLKDYRSCSYCLWLGAGAHYLVFQQKPPQNVEPIDYRDMGMPSVWVELRGKIWKSFGTRVEFQTLPGPDVQSKTLNLTSKKVNWTYTTIGIDYQLNKIFYLLSRAWRPRFLVALQSHSMPFLRASGSEFAVSEFNFDTMSAGVYLDIYESKNLQFMWTNRLQIPMAAKGDIKVNSGISFDGALGAIYFLSRGMTLSGFWGGQYHSLNYDIANSKGKYLLVSSKVSALFGFYF